MIHETQITITVDDIGGVIADHIWDTFRPIDINGHEISQAEIIDSLEPDGSGGWQFRWVVEKDVE